MTDLELAQHIETAIERQEGFKPGTRAWRNNNPGNIWDGLCEGKTRRIWPEYPIDKDGFLVLPSVVRGRILAVNQLVVKIHRGLTLRQAIHEWDSSDPVETRETYTQHVSEWTGIPPDVPLKSLVTGASHG